MPISDLSRVQPTWESQKEALNDGLRTPSLWNITLTPWSWMNISLRRKGVLLKKRGEMSSFKSLTREANAKLDPNVASRYELRSSDSKPIMLTVTQQDSYLAVFTVIFKWNELAASAAVERASPELPLPRRNPPTSAFRSLSPLFCSKSNSFVSSFSCISSSRESFQITWLEERACRNGVLCGDAVPPPAPVSILRFAVLFGVSSWNAVGRRAQPVVAGMFVTANAGKTKRYYPNPRYAEYFKNLVAMYMYF